MSNHAEIQGRVLIIDDNASIHDDIRRILKPEDTNDAELDRLAADLFGETKKSTEQQVYDVDSAFQGREGYEMVKVAVDEKRPYMLAFVDMRMPPGWDGLETISHLWQADPFLQVVICTAYSDRSWQEITETLGQSDRLLILKKPFDAIEVLQVSQALTRKWFLHQVVLEKMDVLESTVSKRTRELMELNEQLKQEITERKRAEDNFKHLATHDSLTDLPNRILLHDRLQQSLGYAGRRGRMVAFLLLDLDHFKEINDVYGHTVGDGLLASVAERLVGCVREQDTVARMGGDEFVVLLSDLEAAQEADATAQNIVDCFVEPFKIEDHEFRVTTSIGVSMYPNDFEDVENLTKAADIAMYKAKKEGRNAHRFYRDGWSGSESDRFVGELARAVSKDELELWYQPLYNLTNGEIAGMEALLRWRHPELGLLQPMQFLPQAEKSGHIVSIGEWVLQRACSQNRAWQDAGLRPVPVGVNLSARQFRQQKLVPMLQRALDRSGLEPQYLVLDVTESTVMQDYNRCIRTLNELYDLGVRIVIDDFGSGYSSLSRLRELPIYALKIDRFFLQNVADDPRDAAIVMAIIGLTQSLKINVIAEGVETQAQLEFLQSLKWEFSVKLRCDMAQGFLLSKPVPCHDAAELIAAESFMASVANG